MKKLIMVIGMLVAFNVMASGDKVEKSTTEKADSVCIKTEEKKCSQEKELSAQMEIWITDSSHWGKSNNRKKANKELVAQIKNWMTNSDYWEVED